MSLQLYNSLTRRIDPFEPRIPGQVTLYTCGPTVYDHAHIGNMRTFVFEDLLKRYLLFLGYNVTHVMNITDVDDRTIKRALSDGRPLEALTRHYTQVFMKDLETLGLLPADHYPRATEFIPQMISAVSRLIESDHAYVTEDGSVYFDISSYDNYGQLAHLDPAQMIHGERVADDDYGKEGARDFALWKSRKPSDGDYYWESPWGNGRPGWHIECSVMSTHFLGQSFDIHCGGVDNIFPHHENEIAQVQSVQSDPFVHYWLHSEHLIVDGEKMSKSLNNYYTLRDVLAHDHSPEAIRYTLLSVHYRQRLNFTFERVGESQKAINRLRELCRRLETLTDSSNSTQVSIEFPDESIIGALDDDLNIAGALGAIFAWVKRLFIALDNNGISRDFGLEVLDALRRYDTILGVIFTESGVGIEIERMIKEREAARAARDWSRADAIRASLEAKGIILEDTSTGTVWKKV